MGPVEEQNNNLKSVTLLFYNVRLFKVPLRCCSEYWALGPRATVLAQCWQWLAPPLSRQKSSCPATKRSHTAETARLRRQLGSNGTVHA